MIQNLPVSPDHWKCHGNVGKTQHVPRSSGWMFKLSKPIFQDSPGFNQLFLCNRNVGNAMLHKVGRLSLIMWILVVLPNLVLFRSQPSSGTVPTALICCSTSFCITIHSAMALLGLLNTNSIYWIFNYEVPDVDARGSSCKAASCCGWPSRWVGGTLAAEVESETFRAAFCNATSLAAPAVTILSASRLGTPFSPNIW